MKNDHKTLSLQPLRAIAALSVVVYHAGLMWRTALVPGASLRWPNGAAGVDIFFVISGAVMVLSASRLSGTSRAGWLFIWARLRRIVPLYWLCTFAKIAGLALTGSGARLGLSYCVASLLFLPVHDAAGYFQPILPVGWTLSFEMLFYALFAASLGARVSPCLAVPPVLLVVTLLPRGSGAWSELSNPILLEFTYGMAIAVLWQHARLNASWAGLPLLLAGSACLLFLPRDFLGTRCLSWGLPAAAMVTGILLLDAILVRHLPRFLLALGDASYAIYLTHGFVLATLPFVLRGTRPGNSAVATMLCAVSASSIIGWLTHRFVERRLAGKLPERTRSPPMVLVLVGGGFTPLSGGVGVLLRNLIDAWANMPEAPSVHMLDTRGAGGKLSGTLHFAWSLLQVAHLCGTRHAHLVHAHMTTRGSTVRKALLSSVALTLRVPVVMHMHGADFIPFYRSLPFPLKILLAAVLRRTAHVVVLGATWRAFLIAEIGVQPGRISILANGVPQPPVAAPLVLPGTPRLLFLGRLCERKGLPELIAALGTPALRKRDWQAVIAGDGDPAPFRAMIGWHRLGAQMHMPGWLGRAETAALLAQADILILPSHHEAMPIAILEALAASVAVITTPVGTIPEFLQHNVNALLVAPGDVAGLAGAIQQLLDNPALRSRLAAAGHNVFREKLEIGGVAARLATLYRSSLATPAWSHSEAAE